MTSSFDDTRRLAALHGLGILDTPAEARFDRFTRLASRLLGTPIALISLVDERRQWFKSRCGIDAQQTPRSIAFCSHAVEYGELLVVEDALEDKRFMDNPLVTGDPHIRFYAGQPLFSEGEAVGTLCIIDRVPRTLADEEKQCLRDLAELVEAELIHTRVAAAGNAAEQALRKLNAELESRVAARTAELQEKQELLDAVLESIDIAVVACDAAGNLTVFNRAAKAVHGLDLKSIAPAEWPNYYSLYHADGRTPMTMAEVPLVTALQGSVVRDHAMAIAPAGRPMHTMLASGRPLRTRSGRPLGAVVAMKDITGINAAREELAANERRLRTITDNVPVLIAYLDRDRRYGFANAVHQSWFGVDPASMQGKTMTEAFGESHHAPQAEALALAWQGTVSQCDHEILHGGEVRFVQSTYLPQLRNGAVDGIYLLTTDATATRLQERSLHTLAHTDALTLLPNRRRFQQALDAIATGSRQGDTGRALLYLDIDYFKQINDTHGHAVGDAVLIEFAARLRSVVRGSDLVARLAGDEFTVLLGDVRSTSDVSRVAGKILDAVRKPFRLDGLTLDVTTTIGASLCEKREDAARILMDTADKALYAAKDAGRNTFAIFAPGTEQLAFAIV